MGASIVDFEQSRLEHEAAKIVSELITLGGVEWAISTVSQIPRFSDHKQEMLRIALKQRLGQLHHYLL